MTEEQAHSSDKDQANREQPFRVRLPGFIGDEVGLGTAIKRATTSVGIRPCGGCSRRAAMLDSWVVFSPWRG